MVISDSQHKIHAGLRNKLLRGLLVALCVVFTSCDDVVDRTTGKSQVRVDVDWSGYGKSVPTGMTIMFHHNETGERTQTIDNNISYVTPYLSPGRHWATAFNLTEEEFGNIRFRGLEAAETAEAYEMCIRDRCGIERTEYFHSFGSNKVWYRPGKRFF